ncbi:MAG: hypothetical protein IBJ00_04470 [Alphaproteobacteria bacterium]|nr:hypothetical protein [Alphaproteobacteria bacterium]
MKIAHLKIMLVSAGVIGSAFLKGGATCSIPFEPIIVMASREASIQSLGQFTEINLHKNLGGRPAYFYFLVDCLARVALRSQELSQNHLK